MLTKVHVKGMHCKSCEILLEREFGGMEGVDKCIASHKKGTVEIYSDKEIFENDIKKAVENSGYKILNEGDDYVVNKDQNEHKNTFEDYVETMLVIASVLAVSFALSGVDFSKLFPDASAGTGVVVALLFGVIASVSTCLALVGGIVMSFGGIYPVSEDHKHPMLAKARPHFYFHIGRIGGFILLGGLLGLIGSKINYSPSFTGYLTILVAVVMFYIGLQILNFVPNISKLGFHLPKSISNKIFKVHDSGHTLAPMIVGVLTFFLPCGFTQAMQLAAVASGNFVGGAMIMGAFAIGTMPVLFSLGLGSSYARDKKFPLLKKFIGVIIIFFALYSINSGLLLSGSNININPLNWFKDDGGTAYNGGNGDTGGDDNTGGNNANVTIENGIQVVKMDVNYGFSPSQFTIKKGMPVRFEINGINVGGCVNSIVIPRLNMYKALSQGANVIEFTPTESGDLPFSCGMGMVSGRFIVTD